MPDPIIELAFKLGLSILVGGLIGSEREFQDKAAGLRTLIFICIGATLFTIWSVALSPTGDSTRMAANVVAGVGFLGAGVILREGGRVVGLTTASTIWLTAALGIGIGGGQYLTVLATTPVVLLVLWFFPWLEKGIDRLHIVQIYELNCPIRQDKIDELEKGFRSQGLKASNRHLAKSGDCMICRWKVAGPPENHARMIQNILSDSEIREFHT